MVDSTISRSSLLRLAAALAPAMIALFALVPADRLWQVTIACGALSLSIVTFATALPRRSAPARETPTVRGSLGNDRGDRRVHVVEEIETQGGARLLVVRYDDREILIGATTSSVSVLARTVGRSHAANEPIAEIPRPLPSVAGPVIPAAHATVPDDHHAAFRALRSRTPTSAPS